MERLGFPKKLVQQIREEQHNLCAQCGEVSRLSAHHRIPRSLIPELKKMNVSAKTLEGYKRFIKSPENCVGLCRRDHNRWDKLTEEKVYFGIDRPLGFELGK